MFGISFFVLGFLFICLCCQCVVCVATVTGAGDEFRIGEGNWSTQRNRATVPLAPPRTRYVLTQDQTQAATWGALCRKIFLADEEVWEAVHKWLSWEIQAVLYSLETLLFFCFWYSFLLEAEWTPGPSAARRIG
jgi:hypothetical protein